jgi:FkbM family methyltransferase
MTIDLFHVIHDLALPPPAGILQVGASCGQELAWFRSNAVAYGVFIEPLDEPFSSLAAVCRTTSGFVAVQTLCTEESGKKYQFHVASNQGMSSSILAPANHLHIFENVQFQLTLEVFSNRLDDVISFLESVGYKHITDNLDTLYMDTQGAELRVLMGAGRILNSIRYIFTEVTRNDLYIGAPSLQDLLHFMDLHGFTLNNVYFNRNQYGDALFIRKDLLHPKR